MSEQVPALGIDFGTTNSSIAWRDPRTGDAEVILNAEGQPKTPSLVHFDENETVVGEPVQSLLQDATTDRARREEIFARTITSIKRNLLSPPRIALPGGRYVKPVEVAAEILKKLKRDAEDGLFHEPVPRAVITCPAEFNVLQRQQIEEAGRLAGFEEVALLEEPVAGALAYARAGLDVGRHVLVYDLGGGTFDLAVLDNEDESFHVAMEPKGVERCGGDDFDVALYHHCDEVAREGLGRPISLTGAVDLGFLQACRRRKESLTFQERGRFSNYLSSENGPVLFEHEVDRHTFEDLIGGYVETTARLTEEIINQAEARGHEVDTVVLVGGSVRVPLVVKTLKETLPTDPLGFDKRDVAIALGAAHYTGIRWPSEKRTKRSEPSAVVSEPPNLDRYVAMVEETYAGGRLSKVGADRLGEVARQLGLSRGQVVEAERRVMGNSKEGVLFQRYRQAVETVWGDGKVDSLEAEWLDALAEDLGLNRDQISYAETTIMGARKEQLVARQKPGLSAPTENLRLAHTLTGHAQEVNSVAVGSDGRFLVSGSSDHTIKGWDARDGRPVGTLAGHTGKVNSVAFSPDGQFLASGGFDNTARVWKLPKGEPFHTFNHAEWVFSVAFDAAGRLLVGGAEGEIVVWSLEDGKPVQTIRGHSHWVLSVAAGPGVVFSGGADKSLAAWHPETGARLQVFEHPDWVRAVTSVSDGRFVASGCDDGRIRLWNPENGELLWAVTAHSGVVHSICASGDGETLYSGGSDGVLRAWEPETGLPIRILPDDSGGVLSVATSPDGEHVVGGYNDGSVKVWRKGLEERPSQLSGRTRGRPTELPD